MLLSDIKILAWNVRGAANKRCQRHLRNLLSSLHPTLLFLFETHTTFANLASFWRNERYETVAVEEAHGHAGGIWALVQANCNYSIQLLDSGPQVISLLISKGDQSFICSGVYGSPCIAQRRILWTHLSQMRSLFQLPWVLLGNFNDILFGHEQRGGNFSNARASEFQTMLDNCDLLDLGYFGNKYTWQRPSMGGRLISRRLDRALGNQSWRVLFPEATLEVNHVSGLFLPNGEWCSDNNVLEHEASLYFKNIFCMREATGESIITPNMPTLSDDNKNLLVAPVTKEEVFKALTGMKSFKAPGPDGFQPIFFKLYWHVVGDDVWNLINEAFQTGIIDTKLAETLIVLIPKVDAPLSYKDFRPISLCNVVYKLITKVLVNRLRVFIGNIMSPLQSSFIPGRSTVDNAIILQEVLHFMNKSKRKKGDLIFKLDLEKAYDRIDWEFLNNVLLDFGFPDITCRLIMNCVSSSSLHLLWNGVKSAAIIPRRGLRQGDPLSPYLFVLCMEKLGLLINQAVFDHRWQPIKISKEGPSISHLFFADDCLLFIKARNSQVRLMQIIIDEFCTKSGLKINVEKSRAFASKTITSAKKARIQGISNIRFTTLGKYLGFPIFYGRPRREVFQPVMDRISAKLATWKGKLLSKPGRVTLANAVISSIPTFFMQLYWFPNYICSTLDQMSRDFIWKGSSGKGINLVAWTKITRRRREGGLNTRISRFKNVSLLGKLVWDLLQGHDKFWVSIMSKKYLLSDSILKCQRKQGS
uniref:LINE-1 reverse transcriptase isogeny n=1 Tax=Cajanus cajan TaxID=3821 RepID=A0A151TKQ5_CAJCA|nr:LINE-1 reverse transcriptase isogeny [Cajanus cajan]